jgi:hypothetical protein
MGLDMYAWAVPTEIRDGLLGEDGFDLDAVDLSAAGVNTDLAYWRKHHHLHGWMQRLYAEKTGNEDESAFNCVYVELTADDLDRLEEAITNDELTPTEGFFFGSHTDICDDDRESDLKFLVDAREAIADGYHVLYHSWW